MFNSCRIDFQISRPASFGYSKQIIKINIEVINENLWIITTPRSNYRHYVNFLPVLLFSHADFFPAVHIHGIPHQAPLIYISRTSYIILTYSTHANFYSWGVSIKAKAKAKAKIKAKATWVITSISRRVLTGNIRTFTRTHLLPECRGKNANGILRRRVLRPEKDPCVARERRMKNITQNNKI